MFVQVARDQAIAENLAKAEEIARLQSEVDRHLSTIAECRGRIQEDETTRRKLHNTIQELKGVRGGQPWSAITLGVGRVPVLVLFHNLGGARALSLYSGSGEQEDDGYEPNCACPFFSLLTYR